MSRRLWILVIVAPCVAAVCVGFGFWQLSRLQQRRQRNAVLTARLAEPIALLTALPPESTSQMRRARITGSPDYEHELLLAPRSYEGSPGVNIVTPLRVPGRDTAVLVNRGWVYAPDGITVDRARWHERDSTFVGYADVVGAQRAGGRGEMLVRDRPNVLRRLDATAIARAIPYPVSRVYLVATVADSATPAAQRVARLPPPVVDEGPHLGYAIQWFSFAVIALVGATVFVARSRAEERARAGNGRGASW